MERVDPNALWQVRPHVSVLGTSRSTSIAHFPLSLSILSPQLSAPNSQLSALNSQLSAPASPMADLIVNGGKPLSGTITPSGNKNSALPILCASLLTDEPVTLLNVPAITDVEHLVTFLQDQGSRIAWDKAAGRMTIDHSRFDPRRLAGELPSGMRS